MGTTTFLVTLASVLGLGLSAGALLAEGALLLPMWRAQPPDEFLVSYRKHAKLLHGFYAPLEVGAALTVVLSTAFSSYERSAIDVAGLVASALAVSVLATFPLYFERVNRGFATGTISPSGVPEELGRFAKWHGSRVVAAIGAFLASAVSLHGLSP